MASTALTRPFLQLDDGPEFLQHVRWSAEPQVTAYNTGSLPIIAFRHHRTAGSAPIDVIADAPQGADWDVVFVNRSGLGPFSVDVCGTKHDVALHRDVCCFFPAGADTRLRFGPEVGSFVIYFKPGVLSRLLEIEGKATPQLAPIVGKRHARMANLLTMIENELAHARLGSSLMIDGLLLALARTLACGDAALQPPPRERVYLSPHKLQRVNDFIEAHLQENIGLDDLARTAELSANHFLRVFKLATGKTPYQFLLDRRLERARDLLANNTMPLAELALECGFANQSHFTAAFTRMVGISPGRYRRAAQT